MGIIDRLFRRHTQQPTRRRAFQAAQVSRLNDRWQTTGNSIDADLRAGLTRVRERARDLCQNNDYARAALRAVRNNVVGQGIQLQAQVRMRRGDRLDEKTNRAIESAWAAWCRRDSAHAGGTMSFADIERMVVSSWGESGEVFVRLVRRRFGRSMVPLALDVMEADMLDEQLNEQLPGGREIRMGIERDEWGRPIAYHFRTRHPGDYPMTHGNDRGRVRIPAADILHIYLPERPGQTRGVPLFASTIMRLHQLQGFEEAEVIAARASASIMGFVVSPEGDSLSDGEYDGEQVTSFEPGTFKRLLPGESVEKFDPARPGGTYDPFVRACLRAAAAGLGVSYETISRDYSQTNYSSSRLSLLEERDQWRVLQAWLIESLHQPIYEAWLDAAVMSTALALPGYETAPTPYQAVRFVPRGWSWVDPVKEVTAAREAVRAGFTTVADVVQQQGGDFNDLLAQRSREVELAAELGVSLDTNPTPPAATADSNTDAA